MLCSGLWAFGRPLLSQALWWWFAKSHLGPAPSSHHHKSNQTGVFPRNAFLLYDLNNSVPELLTHVVTLLCIECVSDISVSVCSIWYTVFIVYICDYHVDFLVCFLPRCPRSASPQRLKIVLLIFNRFNIFYSFEIFWLCLILWYRSCTHSEMAVWRTARDVNVVNMTYSR